MTLRPLDGGARPLLQLEKDMSSRLMWLVGLALLASVAIGPKASAQTSAPASPAAGWIKQARESLAAIEPAQRPVPWELVRLSARTGDYAGARDVIDKFAPKPYQPALVELLVAQQVIRGDLGEAKKALDGAADAQAKTRLTTVISSSQAIAGDLKGALQTTDSLPEGRARTAALVDMALSLAMGGKFDQAKALARDTDALKADRDYIYQQIAVAQAKAGDFDGAAQTVKLIGLSPAMTAQIVESIRDDAPLRELWKDDTPAVPAKPAALPAEVKTLVLDAIKQGEAAKTPAERAKAYATAVGKAQQLKEPLNQAQGLTFIALAQLQAKELPAAKKTITQAFAACQADEVKDAFGNSCGPMLVAALIQAGAVDDALALAKTAQESKMAGGNTARAVGYYLTLQGKSDRFDAYLAKLDNPNHKAFACIGVAMALLEPKK
jgi:hypothetical protein